MERINPDMIVIARESRGLTQSSMATKLSVTQGKISKIESGLLGVSEDMMNKISNLLRYPEHFFCMDEKICGPGISGMGFLYHRKRQNIPIKTVAAIQAQMNIRRIHISRLLRSVELNSPNEMPHYDVDDYNGNIQEIARAVRAAWQLPRGPIRNLTEAIESASGIVIKCDFETTKIDALSQYYPGLPPLFFINSKSPGDRLRFTLAHELAHIVMHRLPNPDMEEEADQFASEFLMPSSELSPSLSNVNLRTLANLKPYWKVSMAAILYRARQLGKISASNYQYLWMQMGKAGYRKHEPVDIPIEEPSTLKRLIAIYRNNLNYSLSEISQIMALNEDEAQSLYFQDRLSNRLSIVK